MAQAQTEDERYYVELKEYLKDYYSGRDDEIRERRKARDGDDFTLTDVPEAYRSTAQIVQIKRNADVLQRTQAIVTDDDAAWEVPPISEDDADKRNASLRERWLAASIERMVEESGRDAIRMACDAALCDSMGILKLTYLPDAWKDEPERKYETDEEQDGKIVKVVKEKEAKDYLAEVKNYRMSAPFPFHLEDVNPLCYYPLKEGRTISKVLELSERPLLPAMQAFGVKATYDNGKRVYKSLRKGEKFPVGGGLNSGSYQNVECGEIWTPHDVSYYLEGQKVDHIQHNYGFINYVELPGYQTSDRDPKKATRSVIDGQRELVKELRRVLTIWLNWAYMAGWPFLEEGEDTGGSGAIPDNATSVTQLKVGAILRRGTRFIEPPQAGRDLGALAQIFQAEADRAGLASVMYGSASGISSGYMGSDLRAAAMSVLKPIIRNGGRAIGRVGQMMQMLIDRRIQDTVYVYGAANLDKGGKEWLALGPKDIKGYYPVKATMRPLMPLDEVAQRDSALRMLQGGLWDPETALERTGENQPEQILDRVAAYRYMEESGMDSRIGERAARKLGLAEEPPAPTTPILGPNGQVLSNVPQGLGGPGIGAIEPSVPGQTMPLIPPEPQGAGLPNRPVVIRGPGGGGQQPVRVP